MLSKNPPAALKFLSTLSLRRATCRKVLKCTMYDISIHALLAESDVPYSATPPCPPFISIHALLAESDETGFCIAILTRYFYPRSPCGERHQQIKNGYRTISFLSTLSLRRATICSYSCVGRNRNFYPRSPCGERHTHYKMRLLLPYFYPRSPCGERQQSTRFWVVA